MHPKSSYRYDQCDADDSLQSSAYQGAGREMELREPNQGTEATDAGYDDAAGAKTAASSSRMLYTPSASRKQTRIPWKGGFLRRLPYLGLFAILLALGCTVGAVIMLKRSEGEPVSEWSGNLQPAVMLSYTSTLASVLLGLALSEALVIAFWRRALVGMNISDYHFQWLGGYGGIMGSVRSLARLRAKRVSIVFLLVSITNLLRSPMMQRASHITTVTATTNGSTNLRLMKGMIEGYGGSVTGHNRSIVFAQSFANVSMGFQSRDAMQITGADCDNCNMTVQAFGFSPNCSTSRVPYNLTGTTDTNAKIWDGYDVFKSIVEPVMVDDSQKYGALNITVTRKVDPGCVGSFNVETCVLYPALVSYDITLSNSTVVFRTSDWRDDQVVELLNLAYTRTGASTLLPLGLLGSSLYDSSMLFAWESAAGYSINTESILANTYAQNVDFTCRLTFSDPMDQLVNNFREVAFRMSAAASVSIPEAATANQTVIYNSQRVNTVYAINYRNLAEGIIVSLVGVVAIIPLFWGWWSLGRKFSMSPVEVGNAFQTPSMAEIMSRCNGNASGDDVVSALRDGRTDEATSDPAVCYGVAEASGQLGLNVMMVERARRPKEGEAL